MAKEPELAICAKLLRREDIQLFGYAAAVVEQSGVEVAALVNPDGPEAVPIIEDLAETLKYVRPLILVGGVTRRQQMAAWGKINAALTRAGAKQ